MTSAQHNILHRPGSASFLEDLYRGRFSWDLLDPFPEETGDEAVAGDEVVAELGALLRRHVDPDRVDSEARLPDGLLDALKESGLLRLQVPSSEGGLGLSGYAAFRVVAAAASWSTPIALVLAIETAVGLGAFLPALPPGPLRDFVRERMLAGAVSGSADTEPTGAANSTRQTTAVPTADGRGYLLDGEKIHIGNGPIADVVTVTATVVEDGRRQARIFFVDCASEGFEKASRHEFLGVKGFPNGRFVLRGVHVPRELMYVEDSGGVESRITPEITRIVARGRMHLITAPSLAIARRCLEWSRDFLSRRTVDGRPLGDYERIRRTVAETAAEVFALDTLSRWCLLGEHRDGLNVSFEQNAAKNISSVAAWRVVDATMALLAGEGYETADSKAARGAVPLPLERAFRDARNFRISGGVDFQIDNWISRMLIFSYYGPLSDPSEAPALYVPDPDSPTVACLSERNRDHLAVTAAEAHRLGEACRRLANQYPDPTELFEHEEQMICLSRIANELLTISLVLARTSHLARRGDGDETQALADVYCTEARHRLADLWRRLEAEEGADYTAVAAGWLGGTGLDYLLGDTVTGAPERSAAPTADTAVSALHVG